jgi:hypothetical protein
MSSRALMAVLTAILGLAILGASIPLPGGPLLVALALVGTWSAMRGRPGGSPVAQAALAVAVLAIVVQVALVTTYAVTSGSDQPAPVRVSVVR